MRTITLDISDELAEQLAPLHDRLPEIIALSLRQPAVSAQLYRAILTFLADEPTPEQIAAFAPPPEIQQRLRTLLDRERDGTVAPPERAESDELERIEHVVVMLKAGALPMLTMAP
jgi:hypothetical protein